MDAVPLQDLPVSENSVWLDHVLQPSQFTSRATANSGASGGADDENGSDSKTLLMEEPKVAGTALRDAAIIAIRSKDEGKYRNPIQKLLFLS